MRKSRASQYKNLIIHKAWADFRAESERNYLGVIWWILEPLINMGIYYLVFGLFLARGNQDFVPYLITGLVVWRFFEATLVRAANSILANMSMVRQIAFNKLIFPLIAIITCVYEFVFSLALLFFVLFLYGFTPTVDWLLLPVMLLILILFTAAFGLPLATIVPFVPDVLKVVTYGLRLLFYMSAIVFQLSWLSERTQEFLWLNPMVAVVNGFHEILVFHGTPSWPSLGVVVLLSFVGIALGVYLNMRFDKIYAKRAAQ